MARIDRIRKIRHDDGRVEIVPCDSTVELLALELGNMGLSYPVSIEDEAGILDRFTDMDAEIGQVETDGLCPTKKYNEQVCTAVDEFNILDEGVYIDYAKLNDRLKVILDRIDSGGFEPYVKIKWRKSRL